MAPTPRRDQAHGNGDDSAQRRMMMRSLSYPSADSPESMISSEGKSVRAPRLDLSCVNILLGGGARLSASSIASTETPSRGIQVRLSRSFDTTDMRSQTP